MFPISSLSFSVYFFIPEFPCLISSSSFFIISIVLCSLFLPPFHLLQFFSNFAQYSLLHLLFDHPNNFLTVNLPGNSPLLNVPFSLSYLLTSSISLLYSFSNSSIASFAFPYHKWPLTDLWLLDLIIKVLKKAKLNKQQKMLLSLRFILRYRVLKYIIVVVYTPEQPTIWLLPIVLHIGVLLFLK